MVYWLIIANYESTNLLSRYLFCPSPHFFPVVVLVGHYDSGKTCLMLSFIHNEFRCTKLPTIGVDFRTKCVEVHSKVIMVQIYNTGRIACPCMHLFLSFSPSHLPSLPTPLLSLPEFACYSPTCYDRLSHTPLLLMNCIIYIALYVQTSKLHLDHGW